MKIGILGGTFDPIHNGHLYLAKEVCKKLSLDKIIFIPANVSPHKKSKGLTSAKHRYNMVKLAIEPYKKFKISNIEIRRKGKSYAIETLMQLRKKFVKSTDFYFITGSDSLKDLDSWRNLEEILKLCKFVVVKRPGFAIKRLDKRFIVLYINAKNILATGIRKRIKQNLPIKSLISGRIIDYISKHNLYF